MRISRTLAAVAAGGCIVAMTSGCELLEPCEAPREGLSGSWSIRTVNGSLMPSTGFPIPTKPERLLMGTLRFQPTTIFGECEARNLPKKLVERGRVIAFYTLSQPNGAPNVVKTYAGSYEYDHGTSEIVMRANGYSVNGTRLGSDLSFSKTIPLLLDLVVDFRQRP